MTVYRSLDFLGFDYYRVGDDGSVWSRRVKGDTKGQIGAWWRLRHGKSGPGSYLCVNLFVKGSRGKTYLIHTLVLRAFIGPRPPGLECRHLNGNPADNRLENLCWGTRKENAADRKRHRTESCGERHSVKVRGELHSRAKLTEEQVREIRDLYATGDWTLHRLSKMFNIYFTGVHKIVARETWRHV